MSHGSRLNTSTARDGDTLSSGQLQDGSQNGDGGEQSSSWNRTGGMKNEWRGAGGLTSKARARDEGRVETARTRARREEEEEKVWKEARKRQLESELAGDLEREWREIAEQRKLRMEVSRLTIIKEIA